MPSLTDDEELARALQEEYQRDYEASRTRQQQQPPPTAPSEEIRPVAVQPNVAPPTATVESDEQLARRLEQEMKDEEMARRLSVPAPSRERPRPSASTLMHSRSRGGLYSAGAPVTDAASSPPRSSRRASSRSSRRSSSNNAHKSSRDSRGTSSGRRSSENGSRDRRSTSSGRRASDWTNSAPSGQRSSDTRRDRRGSSSRRSSDADARRDRRSTSSGRRSSDVSGSTGNPSPSRRSTSQNHRSSSRNAHSSSRGRGSAVSPAVEPDFALPVTSVDPPLVSATIVDTSRSASIMNPYVAPAPVMDPYTASTTVPEPDVDVELAMRLAQEERDHALAEQLERSDQEIASRNATRLATSIATNPRRRPWTCRRVAGIVVPLVLIAGAAVVIMLMVAGRGDLSNIPNIFDDDPFAGNPDDASRWKNKGDGLSLEVVNALQEQWWDNFNIAMDEWDAGTPDALMLSRSSAEWDYDCSPIQGKMKVCNGDYGDTRWKGINQVLLSGGWIISSIAKLNEYYLAGASEAQRQYTTCHEIGKNLCWCRLTSEKMNPSADRSLCSFLFHFPSSKQAMALVSHTRTRTFIIKISATAWTIPTIPQ